MNTARFAALDGLRGLLALLVAFSHATGHFIGWKNNYFFDFNLRYSVDIFFILSGVVLSYAYKEKIENKQINVRDFFVIRFFRLVPLYIFSTSIMLVFFVLQWHVYIPSWISTDSASTILMNILPIQLIFVKSFPVINHPAWSVCTELFWGTFVFLSFMYSKFIFIMSFVVSLVLIMAGNVNVGMSSSLVFFIPEAAYRCIFAMSCGILAFNFSKCIKSIGLIESFIAIFGVLVLFGEKPSNFLYIMYTIIFSLWIVSLTKSDSGIASLLKSTPLCYLGKISYSLYLMHVPVIFILLRMKSDNVYINIFMSMMSIGISMIVSHFIFKDVEHPFIQYMKARLSKS